MDANVSVVLNGSNELQVNGHIKSIEDYIVIKSAIIDLVKGNITSLNIKIMDSLVVTSSLIGYLLKVNYQDNVKVSLLIKESDLYNVFKILNLIDTFNVVKI